MKKKLKRGMSGLLAALLTFTAVFGSGVTALAASPLSLIHISEPTRP